MEHHIAVEGRITSVLAGTMFRAKLDNGHEVLAHISGKMRKRFIRLTVGDRVQMEMSPYDLDKARIRVPALTPAERRVPTSEQAACSAGAGPGPGIRHTGEAKPKDAGTA